MNTYEECRECDRKMRAFKRNQIKKQRREMTGIIIGMVLVSGYLIWQVNRNLEMYQTQDLRVLLLRLRRWLDDWGNIRRYHRVKV